MLARLLKLNHPRWEAEQLAGAGKKKDAEPRTIFFGNRAEKRGEAQKLEKAGRVRLGCLNTLEPAQEAHAGRRQVWQSITNSAFAAAQKMY